MPRIGEVVIAQMKQGFNHVDNLLENDIVSITRFLQVCRPKGTLKQSAVPILVTSPILQVLNLQACR